MKSIDLKDRLTAGDRDKAVASAKRKANTARKWAAEQWKQGLYRNVYKSEQEFLDDAYAKVYQSTYKEAVAKLTKIKK
jgi:hypothetical protein